MNLLKLDPTWTADQILHDLGVSPRDVEAMKIISTQLQVLKAAGVIYETTIGWRWRA